MSQMGRNYHRNYSRNYYHVRRNELVQKLGGKCVKCGSTENLEFDHINANDKDFDIGKLLNRSKQKTDIELQKCQLLCRNCHIEKSKKDISEKLSGENNPFYGKHGKDFPFSKPIIDLDTGKQYESASEYAKEFKLNPNCVARVCRGDRKSIKGHHVRYKN